MRYFSPARRMLSIALIAILTLSILCFPTAIATEDAGVESDIEQSAPPTAPEDTQIPEDPPAPEDTQTPDEPPSPGDIETAEEISTPGEMEIPEEISTPGETEIPEEISTPGEIVISDETSTPGETETPEDISTPGEIVISDETSTPGEIEIPEEAPTPGEAEFEDAGDKPGDRPRSSGKSAAPLTLKDFGIDQGYGVSESLMLASGPSYLNPQTLVISADNENNAHTGAPDGDLNKYLFSEDALSPIEVRFDIDVLPVRNAYLAIHAYDCDETSGDKPEYDTVFVNGVNVGVLTGENGEWNTTLISVPVSSLVKGANYVTIHIGAKDLETGEKFIDYPNRWAIEVKWVQFLLDGGNNGSKPDEFSVTLQNAKLIDKTIYCEALVDIVSTSTRRYEVEYSLVDKSSSASASYLQIISTDVSSVYGSSVKTHGTLSMSLNAPSGEYAIQVLLKDAVTSEILAVDETFFDFVSGRVPSFDISHFFVDLTPQEKTPGPVTLNMSAHLHNTSELSGVVFSIEGRTVETSVDSANIATAKYDVSKNGTYLVELIYQKYGLTYSAKQYVVVDNITSDSDTEGWTYFFMYNLNGASYKEGAFVEMLDTDKLRLRACRKNDAGDVEYLTIGDKFKYSFVCNFGQFNPPQPGTRAHASATFRSAGEAFILLNYTLPIGAPVPFATFKVRVVSQENRYKTILRSLPDDADPTKDKELMDLIRKKYADDGFSQSQIDQILDAVENAEPTYRDIYIYSLFDYEVDSLNGQSGSFFSSSSDGITLGGNTSPDMFLNTWFHEAGHAIDWNAVNANGWRCLNDEELYAKLNNGTTIQILSFMRSEIEWIIARNILIGRGIFAQQRTNYSNEEINSIINEILGNNNAPFVSSGSTQFPDPAALTGDMLKLYRSTRAAFSNSLVRNLSYNNSYMGSDVNGGMTNNTICGGFGHDVPFGSSTRSYYWFRLSGATTRYQCLEAWAEYFSAHMLNDEAAINSNKHYFKDACEHMDAIANEMREYYKGLYK